MFGIKFRTWMESHIVRPRKKQRGSKDGSAGANGSKGKNGKIVPEATLPAAVRLSTNTPALFKKDETPEVLRCTMTSVVHTTGSSPMEPIALSTLHHDCYPRREANNLSSPESAYSTGYSTDGTSPGAGAPFTPPEYYINIRTGTHYFLPNANTPASTGRDQSVTSPALKKPTSTVHFAAPVPSRVYESKSGRAPGYRGSGAVAAGCVARQNPPAACHENAYGYTFKNPAAFLSSPKAVSSLVSNHPSGYAHNHRRTESCDESHCQRSSLDLHDSIPSLSSPRHTPPPPPPPPLTTAQLTASPRQRTRIRTNPWLTANSGNASIPTGGTNSSNSSIYKTIKSTTSSGFGLQKAVDEYNSSHGSSSDKVLSRRKCVPHELNRGSSCSLSSTSSCRSTSDATDDDVTLNEMMGKFDESYIYEKETDILSDSDPTDCDETDFEAGQEGGDERDTQDEEELDFIDNGSLLDLPLDLDVDNAYGATNKGHCTYHDFVRKPRYRESVRRRSTTRAKDDKASPVLKRGSTRKEHCSSRSSRDGSKGRKPDSSSGSCSQNNCRGPSEKKRTRNVVHKSARERNLQTKNRFDGNVVNDKSNIGEVGSGSILFKHILLQKMLSRENAVGTRSAGSTPISSRRKVFTKEVYSPKKTLYAYSNALLNMNKELNLDETLPNIDIQKRRSNSVCYVRTSNEMCVGNKHSSAYSSELALIEADKEADMKYKQLIMEAETILTTMKDQIPMKSLTHIPKPNFFTRKSDLVGGHSSPSLERKDFSKTFREKDVSQFKSDLTIESPSLVHRTQTHRECVRVGEKPTSPSVSANDSGDDVKAYDSNSDGSLTPHQEDFDEQPAQPFKALNERIARHGGTHSSDEDEEQNVASPVRKPDGKSSYKSAKDKRGYKNCGRRDIAITSIQSLNYPRVLDETVVDRNEKRDRQEVPVRCDTLVYRKVTTPLLERRLNIIKSSECVQRRDPMLRGLEESSSKEFKPNAARFVKSTTIIGAPRPQLVAFRSVDLGNELDDSGYCPQSEPVKRKVYTCSATFDRLQKSLAEKGQLTKTGRDSERGQDDSRNSLREQLERLRRERDGKDHGELSPAHHCDTAQKLSLIRRQMLVNTIEGLKRSLEDQSAKLQATYCPQATGQSNSLQLKNS